MATKNPWANRKDSAPKYEAPPKEKSPLDKDFSAKPPAIAAMQRIKSKIMSGGAKYSDPDVAKALYLKELSPFIAHKNEFETGAEYARRIHGTEMMTDVEVNYVIAQAMDNVGSVDSKERTDAMNKRYDEMAREGAAVPHGEETLQPYLVNITWSYSHPTGRSPPVAYSIEGIFYGWDAELTMMAARDFMMDNIVPSANYKSRGIMDAVSPDTSIEPASQMQVGAMAVEGGEGLKMNVSEDMDSDSFSTKFEAMFTRPNSNKISRDLDFGYAGSDVKYKWVGYRLQMA